MTSLQDDALSLDLTVLQALLQRNNNSHGRTLYFKRMKMAVRALQRQLPLLELDSLRHALQVYEKTRQEWTLDSDPLSNVKKELKIVRELLDRGISEIVSRIDHAAEALFVEVARGFFLPLCIVALGCLARIRILIMRSARESTIELQALLGEYKHVEEITALAMEPAYYESTLERFMEPSLHDQQRKFDPERTLQSLGLTQGMKESGDSGDVEMMGDDEKEEVRETKEAPTISHDDNDDDVGESVVGTSASLASESAQQIASLTTTTAHQQDDSDKNLEFLQQIKTIGDRKRKTDNGASEKKKKKKKRKKESKKKKKKDVFDEIFGDTL